MGSIDAVPAAFELTVVDGSERLTFREWTAVASTDWGQIETLTLHARADARAGDSASARARPPAGAMDGADASSTGRPGDTSAPAGFHSRRLVLQTATLVTKISRLREAFAACALGEEGILAPRVWMGSGGPHLAGRFALANREAPFTIRVSVDARSDGRRRLRIGFADVRLFAPFPVPGPLIGVAVARAISNAAARAGADVRLTGAAIEIDPLELALISSLVTRGWRLPDLRRGWLHAVVHSDDEVRLHFGTEEGHPTERLATPATSKRPALPTSAASLEGECLSQAFAPADELLFAGDLTGAERAYRRILSDGVPSNDSAASPGGDRAARTRLLSLRAAAQGDDVASLSQLLMDEWPEYVPGVLYAATVAVSEGDAGRAADLFNRVARLADARGEPEDAALARGAARAALGEAIEGVPHAVQSGGSGNITAKTASVYADEDDPQSRAQVLGDLLQGFDRLTPERRHDAYASFGRVAESTGDLDHAEEAYWRATSVAGDPARRANDLTAHARVLLSRGSATAAASELEEALRLLPLDAVASLADVRQRLGGLYHGLGQWDAARHYLELVLSHEPAHLPTLERLADIYQRLGLFPAAVDTLERLARRYPQPRQRAEALWRQGDILLEGMGDQVRAFEAYLKSSDLDPTFAPTALRVIAGFWAQGQFPEIAAVVDDLLFGSPLPTLDDPMRLRLGIAIALGRGDAAHAAEMVELARARWNASTAAAILAETAALLSSRPSHEIEPAVSLLELWRTTAIPAGPAGAAGSAVTELWSALRPQVMEDPAAPGLARAAGWIAERAGDEIAAGILLSVATFIEEADQAGAHPGEDMDMDGARDTLARWNDLRAQADGAVAPAVVLACGDILAALRALHQIEGPSGLADAPAPERDRRIAFLRTAPARELLRFMVSDSYARALANAAADADADAGV